MNKSNTLVELKNLTKTYTGNALNLTILDDVDLVLKPGELVGLVAPSGTGKSTLLHQIGLLERPTKGEILLNGVAAHTLNDNGRTTLRLNEIGFVYQFHHLLPEFSALENVMMPMLIKGIPSKEAQRAAHKLLETLNLSNRCNHRPSELSGGEQQRVAILRALANNPKLLLADEPTGNLDEATADLVFNELLQVVKSNMMGALIATHNLALAQKMDRVITIKGKKIVPWT